MCAIEILTLTIAHIKLFEKNSKKEYPKLAKMKILLPALTQRMT